VRELPTQITLVECSIVKLKLGMGGRLSILVADVSIRVVVVAALGDLRRVRCSVLCGHPRRLRKGEEAELCVHGSIWHEIRAGECGISTGTGGLQAGRTRQTSRAEGAGCRAGLRGCFLTKLLEWGFLCFLYFLQIQNDLKRLLELLFRSNAILVLPASPFISIPTFQNFDRNVSICRAMWAPHIRYLQQNPQSIVSFPAARAAPVDPLCGPAPAATASAPPSSGLASQAAPSSSPECSPSPPLASRAAPRHRPERGRHEGSPRTTRRASKVPQGSAPCLPTAGVAGRSW
jgi:hypothetical protein